MRMRRGFTLIELLIVLAIIGVLMGIGVPVYTNQLNKAKARVVASNLRTIAQTVANLATLGDDVSGFDTANGSKVKDIVKGIKNPANYLVYATKSTLSGTWDIYVYYTGTDIATKLAEDEIGDSCDASSVNKVSVGQKPDISGDYYVACVLKDIPAIGF